MSDPSNKTQELQASVREAFSLDDYVAGLLKVVHGRTDARARLRALSELATLAGYRENEGSEKVKEKPTVRRTRFAGFLRTAQGATDPAGPRRRTRRRPAGGEASGPA